MHFHFSPSVFIISCLLAQRKHSGDVALSGSHIRDSHLLSDIGCKQLDELLNTQLIYVWRTVKI